LKTPEFKRFVEKMKLVMAQSECSTDYKLEAVLPGVQQRFQTMESRMGTMETNVVMAVRDKGKKMKELIATGFEEAANLFRGGGGNRAGSASASASASAQRTRTSTMAGSAGELAFTELQFYGNHKPVQSMYNK
jgi:hypothetical protein